MAVSRIARYICGSRASCYCYCLQYYFSALELPDDNCALYKFTYLLTYLLTYFIQCVLAIFDVLCPLAVKPWNSLTMLCPAATFCWSFLDRIARCGVQYTDIAAQCTGTTLVTFRCVLRRHVCASP